jgi:DNA end-binding protein Ku
MWCSTSGSFVAWRRRLRPRWKSSNSFRFSEIDPFYLETSYYVAPDEGGEKDYALLLKSMKETGYAALGQVTMHGRDHVMILRSGKTGLIAHSMFYADEVRTADEFRTNTESVVQRELNLAKRLIQSLATSFEPDKFKNQFRGSLNQLIESRAATLQIAPAEAVGPPR